MCVGYVLAGTADWAAQRGCSCSSFELVGVARKNIRSSFWHLASWPERGIVYYYNRSNKFENTSLINVILSVEDARGIVVLFTKVGSVLS